MSVEQWLKLVLVSTLIWRVFPWSSKALKLLDTFRNVKNPDTQQQRKRYHSPSQLRESLSCKPWVKHLKTASTDCWSTADRPPKNKKREKRKKRRLQKAGKIVGTTLLGGVLFGSTDGLIVLALMNEVRRLYETGLASAKFWTSEANATNV